MVDGLRHLWKEVPMLQEAILVGPDEEAYTQVEPEFQQKVQFLSREKVAGNDR